MDAQELLRNRPPMPWWVEIVATALLGTLGLMYANYHTEAAHTDQDLHARVSVIEATQKGQNDKVDHIQTQVDKLVEWALGKK
jgi:hypothetical protein